MTDAGQIEPLAASPWLLPVLRELASASSKFPAFHSAHEGYAVLLEEVDELWREVQDNKSPERNARLRREAIQVAAMALRFLSDVCEPTERGGDGG